MKKQISLLLVIVLLLSGLPNILLASQQQPIKTLSGSTSNQKNPTSGTDQIFPNITLRWSQPSENIVSPNADCRKLTPDYYRITARNLLTNTSAEDTITSADFGKYLVRDNSGNEMIEATFGYKGDKTYIRDDLAEDILSGQLYEMTVKPVHDHYSRDQNGNIIRTEDAPLASLNVDPVYVLTDFNLQANVSDGLTYTFEYVPGVTYELYYGSVPGPDLDKYDISKPTDITTNPIIISPEQASTLKKGDYVYYEVEDAQYGQFYAGAVVARKVEMASGNGLPNTTTANRVVFNRGTSTDVKLTVDMPNLKLEVKEISENQIRILWDLPSSLEYGIIDYFVVQARRYDADNPDKQWKDSDTIGTVWESETYFDYTKPIGEWEYRVLFVTKSGRTLQAVGRPYKGEDTLSIPFAPRIPLEFPVLEVQNLEPKTNANLQDWIKRQATKGITISDYSTKREWASSVTYDLIDDDLTTIEDIEEFTTHTFHYTLNENGAADIQIVWDVMREQTEKQLREDNGETVDPNPLYFDIYIAKTEAEIQADGVPFLTIGSDETEKLLDENGRIIGNKLQHEKLKNLPTNTTYFIKIIAKADKNATKRYWSLPAITSITVDKTEDIFEPPVLGKPPLQIEPKDKVGESYPLEIKWTPEWYEISVKNNDLLQQYAEGEQKFASYGMGRVYLYGDSPYLRFVPEGNQPPYDLYGLETKVKETLKTIQTQVDAKFGEGYYDKNYLESHLRLGNDDQYEIYVIERPTVSDLASYVVEFGARTQAGSPNNDWKNITDLKETTFINDISGFSYLITEDSQGNPLKPNTSYLILLRTYRKVENEIKACVIPSYIIGTTLIETEVAIVKPTTPILSLDSVDITSATVTWPYNELFDYELVYSRLDDPNTAMVWDFTDKDLKTFVKDQNAKATITGLLPDTTYNFWIKAKQKPEIGTEESSWSNPVTTQTSELVAPNAPGGLGLASYQSILEAGQDFMPRLSDSLTLEWSKHADDINPTDPAITYSYRIEFSNNLEFMDSIIINTTTGETNNGTIPYEVIAKNIVRFTELEPNSPYYARAQTIMTYQKDDKTIVLESEWTERVRLTTTTSNEEYDGGENPYVTIYPEPVVQTYRDGVWTYELVDAAKLTTQILKNKAQNYAIQMTYYNGNQDANKRIVKMPMKVMQTLHNQGMNLQLITNIGTYEIPAKSLESYIAGYSATDTVEFDLTKLTEEDITTYIKEGAYQTGERLDIKLRNAVKSTPIYTLNQPMTVKLKTDIEGEYNISDKQPYLYNYNKGEWTKQNAVPDNHFIKYTTPYVGLNALYGEIFEGSSKTSDYLMNALGGLYDIKGNYKIEDNVSASQYVSLLLGIAKNASAIDLTTSATEADYNAAKASGLYISNVRGAISKEQALNGCIRLYEMKHGNAIKPSNATLDGFSSNYQQAAQKAYAVGMISKVANPQQTITYGELFDWLAMAIDGV